MVIIWTGTKKGKSIQTLGSNRFKPKFTMSLREYGISFLDIEILVQKDGSFAILLQHTVGKTILYATRAHPLPLSRSIAYDLYLTSWRQLHANMRLLNGWALAPSVLCALLAQLPVAKGNLLIAPCDRVKAVIKPIAKNCSLPVLKCVECIRFLFLGFYSIILTLWSGQYGSSAYWGATEWIKADQCRHHFQRYMVCLNLTLLLHSFICQRKLKK